MGRRRDRGVALGVPRISIRWTGSRSPPRSLIYPCNTPLIRADTVPLERCCHGCVSMYIMCYRSCVCNPINIFKLLGSDYTRTYSSLCTSDLLSQCVALLSFAERLSIHTNLQRRLNTVVKVASAKIACSPRSQRFHQPPRRRCVWHSMQVHGQTTPHR